MAARAYRLGAAPRPHLDFDRPAFLAKTGLLVDEAGKALAVVQQSDQPHESKIPTKCHIRQHLTGPTSFKRCVGGLLPRSGAVGKKLAVRRARCAARRENCGILHAVLTPSVELESVAHNPAQTS